jgi:hypothetical protein
VAEKQKVGGNSERVELLTFDLISSTLSELLKPFFVSPPIASEVIHGLTLSALFYKTTKKGSIRNFLMLCETKKIHRI